MIRKTHDSYDFEPSMDDDENTNTENLAEYLRSKGRMVEDDQEILKMISRVPYKKFSKPDMADYPTSMGVPIARRLYEAKIELIYPSQLEELEEQIARYIYDSRGRVGGLVVVIYGTSKLSLLNQLESFCGRLALELSLPFGIDVQCHGEII